MQDKDLQARQESLADVGWQRMAVLLDAQMPVSGRKKRRGGLWLWWPVAAAVLIAASAVYVLYPHQNSGVKPGDPQPSIATPALADGGSPIKSSAQADVDKMDPEQAPSQNAQSQKSSAPTRDLRVNATVSPVHTAMPLVADLYSDVTGTLTPGVVYNPATALEFLEKWHETATLPVLFPGALPAELSPHSLQSADYRQKSRRFRFGVEAAAGISSFAGLSALAIGPVAEFKAGRRWSVRSGLQAATARYTLTSGSAGLLRGANNDPATPVDVFDGTALGLVASSVNNGSVWTYSTRSVQMPLYIGYCILPRFRVEAGITPTYIWHAEKATGEIDQESLVQTSANFSSAELDRAVVSSTERFEMLFSAGLRYQASPRWSMGVHYQTSLNDLQPLQALQARQQNLRLSGTMYF